MKSEILEFEGITLLPFKDICNHLLPKIYDKKEILIVVFGCQGAGVHFLGRCLTSVINDVVKDPVEFVKDDVFNRENFKRCLDRLQIRKGGARVVVSAPALSHRIAEFPERVIKIFINRDYGDSAFSMQKKIEGTERPDIWEARELEKYNVGWGDLANIKWSHYKKVYPSISCTHFTTYYNSLSEHKFWVSKKKRKAIDKKNKNYNNLYELGNVNWHNPNEEITHKVLLETN